MSSPLSPAEYRALANARPAGKAKPAPVAPKPVSPAQTAKEAAARAEVVGVGRLAVINTIFGVTVYLRKYRLLDAAQAAELDAHFYALTGTRP